MAILKFKDENGIVHEVTCIKGTDGKSAYEYAKDNGFTGTEEEFAVKMAEEYATEGYVDNKIAEAQLADKDIDLSDYALKSDIPTDYLKSIPEEYVTETELNAKGYLTQHQDLSAYALKSDVPTVDSEINSQSVNPVQSKALYQRFNDITLLSMLGDSTTSIDALQWDGSIKDKEYVVIDDGSDTGYRLIMVRVLNEVPIDYTYSNANVILRASNIINDTQDPEDNKEFGVPYSLVHSVNDHGMHVFTCIESDPVLLMLLNIVQVPDLVTIIDEDLTDEESGISLNKGVYFLARQKYENNEWVSTQYISAFNLYGYSFAEDNITSALGYVPANSEEVVKRITPQMYGAKGDGVTDDSVAFQNALSANRVVFVPGGTYNLSGELVIRDNCHLELAQDVVLNFTQTSGNCITMNRSAFLKGNHATVFVPYGFTGHVINVDTTVHESEKDVEPWIHWDPQWKTARYLTDLNICKTDSYGLGRSTSGDSNGTAVYVYVNGSATSTFIWGMNFSGLRIAGAFEYGVRAVSTGSGYNHEMRIEAFMDAVKVGVSLEDCNNAYISATIQPRAAADGTVYAKHGIQLIRSENTDLLGSRVWDWNDKTSLWTYEKDNVNQHIAMYGDCSGTILNDYNYFHIPAGFTDLRELIYTDTQSNYDSLVIIQEPFTKWFKPIDHEPYFNNGSEYERLVLKKEQDALFETTYIPTFTDQLAKATDGKGAIFNEIGYKKGALWGIDGVTLTGSSYHTSTGYIPCQAGSVLHVKGMSMSSGSDDSRVVLLDSSFTKLMHVNRGNILAGGNYFIDYAETEDGFNLTIKNPSDVAYVVISVYTSTVSNNPAIAVDEEIGYTQVGTMSSGIKVNSTNLINMDGYETKGRMVTQISNASTDAQYPSAKAVYDLVNGAFASYVTDIAALVGGDA